MKSAHGCSRPLQQLQSTYDECKYVKEGKYIKYKKDSMTIVTHDTHTY